MKILLCVMSFMLVTGVAGSLFAAQVDRSTFAPTIDGAASLGWKWDFRNGETGFENNYRMSVKIPLLGPQSFSTQPANVYGELSINGFGYALGGNESGANTVPSQSFGATARLVIDQFFVVVYDPSVLGLPSESSSPFDTFIVANVGPTSGAITYTVGTGVGMNAKTAPDSPIDFLFKVLSGKNGTFGNEDNNYAFGVDVNYLSIVPEVLSLKSYVFFDPYKVRPRLNAGVKPSVFIDILNGLIITPAFDFQWDAKAASAGAAPLLADGSLEINFKLSSPNITDKAATEFVINTFVGTDKDLSVKVTFEEPSGGGLLDIVGLTLSGSAINLLQQGSNKTTWVANVTPKAYWLLDANNRIVFNAAYTINDHLTTTFTPLITYVNTLGIPATVFTATYEATDVLDKSWHGGIFTTSVKISF